MGRWWKGTKWCSLHVGPRATECASPSLSHAPCRGCPCRGMANIDAQLPNLAHHELWPHVNVGEIKSLHGGDSHCHEQPRILLQLSSLIAVIKYHVALN